MSPFLIDIQLEGSSVTLFLPSSRLFMATITTTTVIINLFTASLITLRILYYNRYIRKTVGLEHNSPYMTIIIICVESSALIVVFSSIYLILLFQEDGALSMSIIPMQSLVHVYVRFYNQERKSLKVYIYRFYLHFSLFIGSLRADRDLRKISPLYQYYTSNHHFYHRIVIMKLTYILTRSIIYFQFGFVHPHPHGNSHWKKAVPRQRKSLS